MAKKQEFDNALQTLKSAIKSGQLERLYFFHGEEIFLLQHYLAQIRKQLIDPLTESFNYHKLTPETFDIQSFADAVENLPMMAENTMVEVDEVDIFKLPEGERGKIAEILDDIPEYCTVVFTYETTPWKPDKRLKKLWEIISENGQIVEFAKQNQRDLISWVSRHFLARGKRISNDLCVYLIELTDGTMTSLSGEIAKICSYSGADEIKRADIDAVVEPVIDAVVFHMTDLLGQGNYGAALTKLNELFKMQQEPIQILGAVGGHFRRISAARTLMDGGKTAGELMKLCAMTDYAARKTMDAARRFSAAFLAKASERIVVTDYRMKTSYDEPQRLLEMLILELAQESRNG